MLLSLIPTQRSITWGRQFKTNTVRSFAQQGTPNSVPDVNAITKPLPPKEGLDWDSMSFALTPTNYMFVAETSKGQEFPKGELRPWGPLPLYPAATIINYGQGIFEGLKAFRTSKGVVVFRPFENWKRMNDGADAFLMSRIPRAVFEQGVQSIVRANSEFIPPENRGALYLRPVLFGSGAALGVAPSNSYTFAIYATPVGSYFKGGKITPISLLVAASHHRAAPKGAGHVKAAGNYAPCFQAQKAAKDAGYNEALFVDAKHEKYLEEAGASNIFIVGKDGTIATPGLGTILPGVTRNSIIQLAKQKGYRIEERRVPLEEAMEASEAFCTGTGASLTPVGSITWGDKKVTFNDGQVGKVTQDLYTTLLDLQFQRSPDVNKWLYDPFGEPQEKL